MIRRKLPEQQKRSTFTISSSPIVKQIASYKLQLQFISVEKHSNYIILLFCTTRNDQNRQPNIANSSGMAISNEV